MGKTINGLNNGRKDGLTTKHRKKGGGSLTQRVCLKDETKKPIIFIFFCGWYIIETNQD